MVKYLYKTLTIADGLLNFVQNKNSRQMIKYLAYLVSAVLLIGCASETQTEEKTDGKTVRMALETCAYSLNSSNVQVKWTAFKFTNKTGVGGVFDSVKVESRKDLEYPNMVFSDMSFEILVNSINSNNPERDKKIQDYFFGALSPSSTIKGKIISASGGEREGSILVSLTLNEKTNEIGMKYFVDGQTVTINGSIDVGMWDAMSGINALNSVCKDLHTGEDGESVLWPNVDIEVTATLDKICK